MGKTHKEVSAMMNPDHISFQDSEQYALMPDAAKLSPFGMPFCKMVEAYYLKLLAARNQFEIYDPVLKGSKCRVLRKFAIQKQPEERFGNPDIFLVLTGAYAGLIGKLTRNTFYPFRYMTNIGSLFVADSAQMNDDLYRIFIHGFQYGLINLLQNRRVHIDRDPFIQNTHMFTNWAIDRQHFDALDLGDRAY